MATIILSSNETFNVGTGSTATVIGNSGTEKILVTTGATVTTDQNVERVDLGGAAASYTYNIAGNVINVYSAGVLVETFTAGGTNQSLAFTDGLAVVAITALNAATIGGQAVATATASPTGAALPAAPTLAIGAGNVSGVTAGGVVVVGQPFALTNSTTADALVLTAGNDTVTGAAGTLATGDLIIDASITDADIANLTVNSYTQDTVEPTIANVETLNVTGAFMSSGLDFTNITGAGTVNLSTSSATGSDIASVDDVTAAKVTTAINAGLNVSILNVNAGLAAPLTTGTAGNVTVNSGAAQTILIGNTANTGADTYTLNVNAANTTTTLEGGSTGTDTFTVNYTGGASTLTITNAAAATPDINRLTLNSNTAANTVTLSSPADLVTAATSTDYILVGGTQALTLIGASVVLSGATRTAGESITKAAGAGTLTLQNNLALAGSTFFNKATFDVISNNTAFGAQTLTVNQATTVKLLTTDAVKSYDVDLAGSTAMTAGAGVLTLDLAGSSVTNATQAAIVTGAGVGTLVLTNNTIDSTITTLDTSVATGDAIVVSGTKNLTIGTFIDSAGDILSATGLSGNLTVTAGVTGITVVGGSGADALTGCNKDLDNLSGGAGNDIINGGGVDKSLDILTGGTGNDIFILSDPTEFDRITDFSTSGANGADTMSLSIGGLAMATPIDGAAVAITAGTTAGVKHVAAATTLVAANNVIVIDGVFVNSTALLTAIQVGGSRQLTFGAATAAGDNILVAWTDGTNGHIGAVIDVTGGGTTLDVNATYGLAVPDIALLNGVTSVTGLTSSNFLWGV